MPALPGRPASRASRSCRPTPRPRRPASWASEPRPGTAALAPAPGRRALRARGPGRGVEDHPDNQTRFVALAPDGVPAPTGHDKTSIVCFQREDRPGSLHGILSEFAARSINLTKLESRPTKTGTGQLLLSDRPRGPSGRRGRRRLPPGSARRARRASSSSAPIPRRETQGPAAARPRPTRLAGSRRVDQLAAVADPGPS